MHRMLTCSAGAVLATALFAGPAYAASSTTTTTVKKMTTTKPTTTTKTVHQVRWRDISGVFTTMAAADQHLAALQAKGITGFTVLTLHTPKHPDRFEVERTFTTHTAANAEAKTLHKDGFSVRVVRIVT